MAGEAKAEMGQAGLRRLDGAAVRAAGADPDSAPATRNIHPLRRRHPFATTALENHELGLLPQLFADQLGWPEMAATVAGAYNSLPPGNRARTAIFGQNYGEAGAIYFFGPRYGLPPAISGHQSYFLWGPRGYTGESIILMGRNDVLASQCNSVRKIARVSHPYSMPRENFDVFYCEGLKQPLSELWPRLKNWN